MNRENLFKFYKTAVTLAGGVSLITAIAYLPQEIFSLSFVFIAAFTILVMPRMSIVLPRSKAILSFSDSVIFLCFILYGGAAAILLAVIESFVSCLYLKKRGVKISQSMLPYNIGSAAVSTTLTYFLWSALLQYSVIDVKSADSTDLIFALGFLAIAQFLAISLFVVLYTRIKTNASSWQIWRRDCFPITMTQIIGAGLAGIAYKLIITPDFLTTVIALLVSGIVYINYRQTIADINDTIRQTEQAEREKAVIAEAKATEAIDHAAELKLLLQNEEQTNEALLLSKDALEHAAFHDFLTDLPNRTYLVERLNLLIQIGSDIARNYYVLFLDLKRFKFINDSLGHTVGDRVLKLVGKRLVRLVRKEDTVARLGGDEFAIILTNLASVEEAKQIAEQIYERLTTPFRLRGNKIYTDVSIGVAPFDAEHQKPEDILRDADIAMHHAKEVCCGVAVFDKELRARYLERITLESDLPYAVERGELSMHYQPLISLKDGELIGFEALLRWQHPRKGFIPPVQFIPIAEETGLILPITKWILHQTCTQLAEWQKLDDSYKNLLVSVNISGRHLADDSLVEDVRRALDVSAITPDSLKLEITETTAMANAEQSIEILNRLKNLGVQLSIDDFGTGFSSLSYLHRLPFDTLKIDRSFVSDVGERGENAEVLQTILSLAKNLKMLTIAEGIETESQLKILQNLGCDYGQGYLMSKPLPADAMEKALYQKHEWLPSAEKIADDSSGGAVVEESLHIF